MRSVLIGCRSTLVFALFNKSVSLACSCPVTLCCVLFRTHSISSCNSQFVVVVSLLYAHWSETFWCVVWRSCSLERRKKKRKKKKTTKNQKLKMEPHTGFCLVDCWEIMNVMVTDCFFFFLVFFLFCCLFFCCCCCCTYLILLLLRFSCSFISFMAGRNCSYTFDSWQAATVFSIVVVVVVA